MGIYINPNGIAFRRFVETGKYVDKTGLLKELNAILDDPSSNFVCISRPRRFGKTLAGEMIAAFYSKGADTRELFEDYEISKKENWETYLNTYNVIQVDLNAMYSTWKSKAKKPENVVYYINEILFEEFKSEFADVIFKSDSLAECIQAVYAAKGETFVIIIDEYDILVREEVPKDEFDVYLAFLNSLFKNSALRSAISLAYLTGILPIIRDKIQSKLNTFEEYTFLSPEMFSEYTGFTNEDVRNLCEKNKCDFELLKSWYDGYRLNGIEIYNPQSVFKAITKRKCIAYWSGTSTYQVVSEKIRMNFSGIKDAVITMLAGGRVDVNVEKYENRMDSFNSKDDVFTFLIHLGYLAYDADNAQCYIPNREIHNEWQNAISDNVEYAETNKIISQSKILLEETLQGNENSVASALDVTHIHVTSNRSYNNEDSLQSAIYLAYIYALNSYTVIKEMTTGKGFADIVYIPFDKSKSALIIELKHNKSAESALKQIKEKKYSESLSAYSGNILFVGISYDEKTKKHDCKIEKMIYK